jgi:hypothetical protein
LTRCLPSVSVSIAMAMQRHLDWNQPKPITGLVCRFTYEALP